MIKNQLWAQWNQTVFQNFQGDSNNNNNNWELRGLHYLKNNEYFNRINPGQTHIGVQMALDRKWILSKEVKFQVGAFGVWDYGDKKMPTLWGPLVRLTYTKTKSKWIFGSLLSGIAHNMPDPIYSYESPLKRPFEYGVQYLRNGKNFNGEIWLDWRNKLLNQRGSQEQLVGGARVENILLNRKKLLLSIPIYVTAFHMGGQNVDPSVSLVTRFNVSSGVKAKVKNNWETEFLYLIHSDPSPNRLQPFKDGKAFWANLTWISKRKNGEHRVAGSYFISKEFVNTLGNMVFTNVNLEDVYQNNRIRELVMIRYQYLTKPIQNHPFLLDFRLEPYYDINYRKPEFSASLHAYFSLGVNH